MIARWRGVCAKCETAWEPGDEIKPRFVPAGLVDGKMTYRMVPKSYVHKTCDPAVLKAKKAREKAEAEYVVPLFDETTGEILR